MVRHCPDWTGLCGATLSSCNDRPLLNAVEGCAPQPSKGRVGLGILPVPAVVVPAAVCVVVGVVVLVSSHPEGYGCVCVARLRGCEVVRLRGCEGMLRGRVMWPSRASRPTQVEKCQSQSQSIFGAVPSYDPGTVPRLSVFRCSVGALAA